MSRTDEHKSHKKNTFLLTCECCVRKYCDNITLLKLQFVTSITSKFQTILICIHYPQHPRLIWISHVQFGCILLLLLLLQVDLGYNS